MNCLCVRFVVLFLSCFAGCSKSELEVQQQIPDNIPSVQVASVRLSTQSRDLLARHRPLNQVRRVKSAHLK